MRTENAQTRSPDPKRTRKLVLHKETIKNLETNGSLKDEAAPFPTNICTGADDGRDG